MARRIDGYFERIGYSGSPRVDFETLTAVHRAHVTAIPYENLEIQLGRENVLDEAAFFDKIVDRGRGGWCYEMNGLLTWALGELGFDVARLGGAVGRDVRGNETTVGSHLIGVVELDRPYIVDVGLGDGPLEPFPLEERSWSEGRLKFDLERLDRRWWRLNSDATTSLAPPTFDFDLRPRQLEWYETMCRGLQTWEYSPFVSHAMVIQRSVEAARSLVDSTYTTVTPFGHKSQRRIHDKSQYLETLKELLGRDLGDEAETLWQQASARARKAQQAKAEN